ncbi:unnamed protein product [Paramecium sonneborni]|uniref:Uncharacterized protein n=1 Tax=Paramecium sonneborni TaxID=65129 RepID=A0A8S1LGE4_9CILI|nr:unnamed protein product [Paramecium sonneborni]
MIILIEQLQMIKCLILKLEKIVRIQETILKYKQEKKNSKILNQQYHNDFNQLMNSFHTIQNTQRKYQKFNFKLKKLIKTTKDTLFQEKNQKHHIFFQRQMKQNVYEKEQIQRLNKTEALKFNKETNQFNGFNIRQRIKKITLKNHHVLKKLLLGLNHQWRIKVQLLCHFIQRI